MFRTNNVYKLHSDIHRAHSSRDWQLGEKKGTSDERYGD